MKLGTQIYSTKKNRKCIQINVDLDERWHTAINFTGYAWIDHTYKIVKNLISSGFSRVIVTDSDLIARDDYIKVLPKDAIVVLTFNPSSKHLGYTQNNIFGTKAGASLKRLKAAKIRLEAAGIKVVLRTSTKTVVNYINKIKQ